MPTVPTSMIKRLMGTEPFTDALDFNGVAQTIPAGSTIGGRPIAGSGSGVVNTTATTLSLTSVLHANKVVVVDSAAPIAITLPASTGTGDRYEIVINTACTATSSTVTTAASAQVMAGVDWAATTSSNAVLAYVCTATDNKISLNGTTQGGVKGDKIVLIDVKTSQWNVQMYTAPTGSTATPFSHV